MAFLVLSFFFLLADPAPCGCSVDGQNGLNPENEKKILPENEMPEKSEDDQNRCNREAVRAFANFKEAEKFLECLEEERNVLVGDFYGINLTAYRYVNIFDRLGYIRYKIAELDKKIKRTKIAISRLREEKK